MCPPAYRLRRQSILLAISRNAPRWRVCSRYRLCPLPPHRPAPGWHRSAACRPASDRLARARVWLRRMPLPRGPPVRGVSPQDPEIAGRYGWDPSSCSPIASDPSGGSLRRNSSTRAALNGNMSRTGVKPTMPIRRFALSAMLVSSKRRMLLDAAGTGRHLACDDAIAPFDHDVGRTRHAWIERSDCAQDVDPLEFALLAEIVFHDRRVQDGLLVGAW